MPLAPSPPIRNVRISGIEDDEDILEALNGEVIPTLLDTRQRLMNLMLSPLVAFVSASSATISTGSFVDVSGMLLDFTLYAPRKTSSAHQLQGGGNYAPLYVWVFGTLVCTVAPTVTLGLVVDGEAVTAERTDVVDLATIAAGSARGKAALIAAVELDAGHHTIQLQGKTTAGTVELGPASSAAASFVMIAH